MVRVLEREYLRERTDDCTDESTDEERYVLYVALLLQTSTLFLTVRTTQWMIDETSMDETSIAPRFAHRRYYPGTS